MVVLLPLNSRLVPSGRRCVYIIIDISNDRIFFFFVNVGLCVENVCSTNFSSPISNG